MAAFVAAAALAAAGFFLVPWMILSAPLEPVMGFVQKIFYFHVPCAIMLFLSTFVCAAGSIAYLFKGSERGDRLALAAGELGVLFGTCVLVTGPLWGRKAWGVWWQWDARLTSTLVMWMIFNAYLLLRRYGGPGSDRLAAAVALFGMANVPFVYWSVNVWRTLHPKTSVIPSLQPGMRGPFWFCVVAFLLLFSLLLSLRMELEKRRQQLDELYLAAEGD